MNAFEQWSGVEAAGASSKRHALIMFRRFYGDGRWRKCKGEATVRLSDGTVLNAEIHWYEATGFGKREFKIKRYLE